MPSFFENEVPEETTVTDKDKVEPIEETSTEEAIVPTGAPKFLNKFKISYQLWFIKHAHPSQGHK